MTPTALLKTALLRKSGAFWGGGSYRTDPSEPIGFEAGYDYALGTIPYPRLNVRFGGPDFGVSLGTAPDIDRGSESGVHEGWMGDPMRSLWRFLGDGGDSYTVALSKELRKVDPSDTEAVESILRDRGFSPTFHTTPSGDRVIMGGLLRLPHIWDTKTGRIQSVLDEPQIDPQDEEWLEENVFKPLEEGEPIKPPQTAKTAKTAKEVLTAALLHHSKVAVEVIDRSGWQTPATWASQTVGRVHPDNLLGGAVLGTGRGIWDTSNPQDIRHLVQSYAEQHEADLAEKEEKASKRSPGRRFIDWLAGTDPRGQGELMVTAGGPAPLKELNRIWRRPGISLPGRMLGTASLPFSTLLAMARGDHYNPASHTVVSYANEPAIQAHELGHAADFAQMNHPTLYGMLGTVPFVNLWHEGRASFFAPRLLERARELRDAARDASPEDYEHTTYDEILDDVAREEGLLSAAYGTYLGSAIGRALGTASSAPFFITTIAGRVLGSIMRPWSKLSGTERKRVVEAASEAALADSAEEAEEIVEEVIEELKPTRKAAAALYALTKRTLNRIGA